MQAESFKLVLFLESKTIIVVVEFNIYSTSYDLIIEYSVTFQMVCFLPSLGSLEEGLQSLKQHVYAHEAFKGI